MLKHLTLALCLLGAACNRVTPVPPETPESPAMAVGEAQVYCYEWAADLADNAEVQQVMADDYLTDDECIHTVHPVMISRIHSHDGERKQTALRQFHAGRDAPQP